MIFCREILGRRVDGLNQDPSVLHKEISATIPTWTLITMAPTLRRRAVVNMLNMYVESSFYGYRF